MTVRVLHRLSNSYVQLSFNEDDDVKEFSIVGEPQLLILSCSSVGGTWIYPFASLFTSRFSRMTSASNLQPFQPWAQSTDGTSNRPQENLSQLHWICSAATFEGFKMRINVLSSALNLIKLVFPFSHLARLCFKSLIPRRNRRAPLCYWIIKSTGTDFGSTSSRIKFLNVRKQESHYD